MRRELWPVTILTSRYGGAWEGGKWLAFHCDPWEVPEEVFGDDVTCNHWFYDHPNTYGAGQSPEAAVAALVSLYESEALQYWEREEEP